MAYNWQQKDWPDFAYDTLEIQEVLTAFSEQMGLAAGMVSAMDTELSTEVTIDLLVLEAMKTSQIEGEFLERNDVLSSIRNNLGLNKTPVTVKDKRAEGIGKLMVHVRQTYDMPLTREILWYWHEVLMTGNRYINAGKWRAGNEPMQVISGPIGNETIHFEAPPSERVDAEMEQFVLWFNDTAPGGSKELKQAVVRAAVAHLYFESIHPFEDGNGRIGRAIAEKALSQTIGRLVTLSLSRTIEANKRLYYQALEHAQRGNNITEWIVYFADTVLAAQREAAQWVAFVVSKAKFFEQYGAEMNERELKGVRKMFDAGPTGFQGGMNAAKYMSITRVSKATATRDLQHLAAIGALVAEGGGRSVHYLLNHTTR